MRLTIDQQAILHGYMISLPLPQRLCRETVKVSRIPPLPGSSNVSRRLGRLPAGIDSGTGAPPRGWDGGCDNPPRPMPVPGSQRGGSLPCHRSLSTSFHKCAHVF